MDIELTRSEKALCKICATMVGLGILIALFSDGRLTDNPVVWIGLGLILIGCAIFIGGVALSTINVSNVTQEDNGND